MGSAGPSAAVSIYPVSLMRGGGGGEGTGGQAGGQHRPFTDHIKAQAMRAMIM